MAINLPLLKKHLHVEHDDDDDIITHYYEAAKQIVAGYLDLEIVDSDATDGQVDEVGAVTSAIFNVAADLYDNRGETSTDLQDRLHNILVNVRSYSC